MRWVSGWTLFGFSYFLLRHLVYPNTLRRSAWVSSLTRLEMLLLCFYVAGNALCMGVGVESTAEAATRSGLLSVINLIPLFAGLWLGLVADLLGVSLRSQLLLHKYMGMITTIQGAFYSAVAIFGPPRGLWDRLYIFSAVVCIDPL